MMLLNSVLISSFLCALTVFANSEHYEHQRSAALNRVEQSTNHASSEGVIYSGNWAGALLTRDSSTFTTVKGTFEAPLVPHLRNSSFSVFVGIDGDSCTNVTLQAGISFLPPTAGVDGCYQAWAEWYPGPVHEFPDFYISQGDLVEVSVVAKSANTGIAIIENITKHQNATREFSYSPSLCMRDAAWIVNEYVSPYTDFGEVIFLDALALGSNNRTYTLAGATPVDLLFNNNTVARASINKHSVVVTYEEHQRGCGKGISGID